MANEYMMALGEFRFSIATAAYQEMRRSVNYRWQSQDRLNRSPANQFIGAGAETIDLNGTIYPAFKGGLQQIEQMRAMAANGEALLLVTGTGDVLGKYIIARIEETTTHLQANGQAMRQDFKLSLQHYGEDA